MYNIIYTLTPSLPQPVNPTCFQTKAEVEELLSQLGEGELFCDPDFPPDYHALFNSPGMSDENVTWLRPQVCALFWNKHVQYFTSVFVVVIAVLLKWVVDDS